MQKSMVPVERARKTGPKMVWFVMFWWKLTEIWGIEITFILLIQHFPQFSWIFNHPYLGKFSSKHNEPYHFLDQFFELFPLVPFIFTFEQLHKMMFIPYKGVDPYIENMTSLWRDNDVSMSGSGCNGKHQYFLNTWLKFQAGLKLCSEVVVSSSTISVYNMREIYFSERHCLLIKQ